MRRASGHAPANALFVVAAAEALPAEMDGTVDAITVAFPWGSLLHGLLEPSPAVLGGIARVLRPGGTLTALLSLTEREGRQPLVADSIDRSGYAGHGLAVTAWRPATLAEVAASDSSWAERLRVGEQRPAWVLRAARRQGIWPRA